MGRKEQNDTIDRRQANLKTTMQMFGHTVVWNIEVLGSGVKITWTCNSSLGAFTSQVYLMVELNDPRGLFQP